MKINEVIAQQSATLKNVEVVDKEEPREFQKFGRPIKVCNGTIKDDSGEMQLTLWNDEIDQINKGDKIDIIDGWVKEWQGDLQISSGRNGKIVMAGSDSEGGDAEATETTTSASNASSKSIDTTEAKKDTTEAKKEKSE